MSYAQTTPVLSKKVIEGRNYLHVSFSETGAGSTSEFTVEGIPPVGTVVLYRATLTSGTGTTIAPALGRAASFVASTQNHIGSLTPAAASHNTGTGLRYAYLALAGHKLYGRSTPDGGSDNAISTEILILEGVI